MSFCVVIPSGCADNVIACVQALMSCEPTLLPSAIIVVNDGARAESEPLLPAVTWVEGKKPFVFARNVNLGLAAAGSADVIVLGDDGQLLTPGGFTALAAQMREHPEVGVCSAGICGVVCNPNQQAGDPPTFRYDAQQLAFVCVGIPRAVISRVGVLDERFVGYGFDDFDYCRRVLAAGLRLAVWDGCVVDHRGDLPSAYRTNATLPQLFSQNRQLYEEKWSR